MKLIATNTTIKLPDRLAEGVSGSKSLSSEEKAAIIKEVRTLCNDVRKADRLYRINVSPLEPHSTLRAISCYACHEHLSANNGSFKDVEKSMAEALVCSNFNFSDIEKENFLRSHKELKDISEVTNAHIIAHTIASVLPECVGKYSEQFPKILNVVQKSEMAMEKVKLKEALKEQGCQQALWEYKRRTTGHEM